MLDGVTGEGEGAASVERLRFGTYLASNVRAVALYELVTEEVGRRLGLPTELVVETSYESCEMGLNEVCFVCSLPYVTFERRPGRPAHRNIDVSQDLAGAIPDGRVLLHQLEHADVPTTDAH